jgi:hypothetical protein
MNRFVDIRLLSTKELEAFLGCCDMRARRAGFASWQDPTLAGPLKKAIVLKCIEASPFPVEVREE